MIASEAIQECRTRFLDDWAEVNSYAEGVETGQLWTDAVLLSSLNWAQRKAADWALLIRDDSTADICSIELESGTRTYALDPRIIKVNSISINMPDGRTIDFEQITKEDAKRNFGTYYTSETGDPIAYIPKGWSIDIAPVPSVDYTGVTLTLDVFRLPLANAALDDELEIPEAFQDDLLYGVAWQAMMLRDAQAENLGKLAMIYRAKFLEIFGPELSGRQRVHRLHSADSIFISPMFSSSVKRNWTGTMW